MDFSKDANAVFRRFIASSAATIQSRKKLRLAHGVAPSAAESTHGMVLTANFSQQRMSSTKANNDRHSHIQQVTEIENVWEAKAIVDLCPGGPDADAIPTDIFSLPDIAEGEKYYAPSKFKPSANKGWASFKAEIQQAGYRGGWASRTPRTTRCTTRSRHTPDPYRKGIPTMT